MLSVESEKKLSQCHSLLQAVIRHAAREMDMNVSCGHREQDEQDAAFTSGKSKVQWPNGKHNSLPSLAVDVQPLINGKIIWGNTPREMFQIGYMSGRIMQAAKDMDVKVRWGADWDGDIDTIETDFLDSFHFELVKP